MLFPILHYTQFPWVSMENKRPAISNSYPEDDWVHLMVLKFSVYLEAPSPGKSYFWEQEKESYSNQLKGSGIWLDLLLRPEISQKWNIARPLGTWSKNSEVARNLGPALILLTDGQWNCLWNCTSWPDLLEALANDGKLTGSHLAQVAPSHPQVPHGASPPTSNFAPTTVPDAFSLMLHAIFLGMIFCPN